MRHRISAPDRVLVTATDNPASALPSQGRRRPEREPAPAGNRHDAYANGQHITVLATHVTVLAVRGRGRAYSVR
ncbi:hypothetical protein GCM10027521_10000 [Amycolatopsis cihanbeyliensis]